MLQATILKEREAMQAVLAEKDKEMRELEERTTALVEAERARNDASTRAIYELFVVSFFFMLFQILHFNVRFINKKKFHLSKPNVQSMSRRAAKSLRRCESLTWRGR